MVTNYLQFWRNIFLFKSFFTVTTCTKRKKFICPKCVGLNFNVNTFSDVNRVELSFYFRTKNQADGFSHDCL